MFALHQFNGYDDLDYIAAYISGSSTDPMLFTQTSSNSNIDDKQRHISDETIAIVAQQVRTVVERKASGDTQLGTLFADAEVSDAKEFIACSLAFKMRIFLPLLNNHRILLH